MESEKSAMSSAAPEETVLAMDWKPARRTPVISSCFAGLRFLCLVWSPDQEKLIFSRVHDTLSGEQHSKIYVLDVATGDMKSLARDQAILAWR